jgi:CBS domain-containing protein
MKTASDFLVDVPLLHCDDPVTRARKIMREDIYRELYVYEGQRKLLGYIDITDVLRVTATKSNVTIKGYIRQITPVSPGNSVRDVLVAIRENATDSIPVVDGQNTILGGVLLSELFPVAITTQKLQGTVGDCMSPDVITCTSDDTAQKVHNLMTESGFTAFPVVKKRRLVGMISRRDLLRDGRWRTASESSIPIEGIMTTPVMTVSPDDSTGDAAALMVKYDISRLPVTEGDHIVGIIDRHDILKILG